MTEKIKPLKTRVSQQLKNLPSLEKPINTDNTAITEIFKDNLLEVTAFLEAYQASPDLDKVCKSLKIKKAKLNKWLQNPQFKARIDLINERYLDAITEASHSKTVIGWQVNLIRKMEKLLDEGDTKVASALSNSMGNLLKATGSFADTENSMPEINVNIDLGTVPSIKKVDEV